jgi:putative membrane protein
MKKSRVERSAAAPRGASTGIVMFVAMALAPALAGAQGVPGTPKSPAGWPAVAEVANQNALSYTRQVIARIRQMNDDALHAGQLAQARAGAVEVRRLGHLLIADHAAVDRRVAEYANRKLGVNRAPAEGLLPVDRDLMAQHLAATERMAKLSGGAFDLAFLTLMVRDHQSAVNLMDTARETVDDPDLRAIFGKNLALLRQDLWIAQSLLGVAERRS